MEANQKKQSTPPRVTLVLVINGLGFTVFNQKHKGNQLEPIALKNVLKDEAMDKNHEDRFLEDVEKLNKSVLNGKIKKADKVYIRVGKLKQKYSHIAKYYEIQVKVDEKTITALSVVAKKQVIKIIQQKKFGECICY